MSESVDFQLSGPVELATFVPPPEEEPTKSLRAQEYVPSGFVSYEPPEMGLTENKAATYLTSGSACLDLFFQVVPDTSKEVLIFLLSNAWKEDPLLALKLIFQLRGVRGTGKSDKNHFYDAAIWMFENHPRTLAANIQKVPFFGYYKDLLEIVQRIVEGEEETQKRVDAKAVHKSKRAEGKRRQALHKRMQELKKKARQATAGEGKDDTRHEAPKADDNEEGETSDSDSDVSFDVRARLARVKKPAGSSGYYQRKGAAARAADKEGTLKPRDVRIAEDIAKGEAEKQKAAVLRKHKIVKLAYRVVTLHKNNPEFAAMYNAVARIFADALARDLEALKRDGYKARISLAAKWCPSLDAAYDKQTLLCEPIACMFFPKSSSPEYSTLPHHVYVQKARDRLRKEVLVPLRKALELPEVYMTARRWQELPYKRVASVAMKIYKEIFIKHDEKRFKKYLDDVESGEKKIAAGALLPHEILMSAVKDHTGDAARVAELQWKAMVEELKSKGSLPNSVSICDVSGSMSGTPMEVCIALGMITAELAEEPWKGKLITFSNEPAFHELKGNTLKEKYTFTQEMPWDMNTDFQKVFDRILELAKASNLPPEKMIKTLFVYSDMEFDQARKGGVGYYGYGYQDGGQAPVSWETDYMQITRKFNEAGYGKPPQIVFWNLRDSRSTPVTKDQEGVALVSGFSKNMLKVFLDKGNLKDFDPVAIMNKAVSGEEFEGLKVVD